MTEQQFTNELLKWAKAYGWKRFHTRTSGRMSNGKAIPTTQGDKGFPDLVLLRGKRLLFAELKVGKNKPSDEQLAWIAALDDIHTVEVHLWRPEQWSQILVVLSKPV